MYFEINFTQLILDKDEKEKIDSNLLKGTKNK